MAEYQGERLTPFAANELAKQQWGELGKAKFIPFSYQTSKVARVATYLVGIVDGKNFITKGYSFLSFEAAFRMADER